MKNSIGAFLAIFGLAVVFSAGTALAQTPLGGFAAVGLTTYGLSFLGETPLNGVFMGIGPIRPLPPGESNLGGNLFVDIFTIEQLEVPDGFYPEREKGYLTDPIPVKTGEKARRIYFDMGTLESTTTGNGEWPNESFLHGFTGRIAGWNLEGTDSMDDLYQMPFIAIMTSRNKDRKVFGSAQAPLVKNVNTTSGAKADAEGGPGRTFTARAKEAVDFEPRFLDPSVVYTREAEPAAPAPPAGG